MRTSAGTTVQWMKRERRWLWDSRPSAIVVASSVADVSLIVALALFGILMAPLSGPVIVSIFIASVVLAFVLDILKRLLFARLRMT